MRGAMDSAMGCQVRCEKKHVAALGLDNLVDLGRPWNIDRFHRETQKAVNGSGPLIIFSTSIPTRSRVIFTLKAA